MSVVAHLDPHGAGDAVPVPIAGIATVGALRTAVHAALSLSRPTADYDVVLRGGDGAETYLGSDETALADVGVLGCDEEVAVRVKYKFVAREVLREEGIDGSEVAAAAMDAAVAGGDVQRLELIAAAALVDNTAFLHEAVGRRDSEAVGILLRHGANAASAGPSRGGAACTPLLRAVENQDTATVAVLLKYGGVDVNEPDTVLGRTPLMHTLAKKDLPTARLLLAQFPDVSAADTTGKTALHEAASWGCAEMVRALLDRGAAVDAKTHSDYTPLAEAAERGHIEVMNMLVACGASVDERGFHGATPLWHAAWGGRDSVQCLLAHGARVHTANVDLRTPLHVAAQGRHCDAIALLLAHGAPVDAREVKGRTPLMYVASCGGDAARRPAQKHACHLSMMNALLEHGADVDARDHAGRTPLMVAVACRADAWPGTAPESAQEGHLDLPTLLLDRGAAVDARGNDGRTPLMHAADQRCTASLALLIERGADVNAADNAGITPLMRAARGRMLHNVRVLLDNGAEVGAADANGATALEWARGNTEDGGSSGSTGRRLVELLTARAQAQQWN